MLRRQMLSMFLVFWLVFNITPLFLSHAQSYSCPLFHVVRSKDNLEQILSRYSLSEGEFKNYNPYWEGKLESGSRIVVGDLCDNRRANLTNSYIVRKGDTLFSIARSHGLFVSDLKHANDLKDDHIFVGQVLTIPAVYQTLKEIRENITEEELSLLAKLVYAEAQGEPFEGQVAVAAVVLNRVLSPMFPSTIKGVIYQEGQFSSVLMDKLPTSKEKADLMIPAVQKALEGYDPTHGAVFFANLSKAKPGTKELFQDRVRITTKIGEHTFGKLIEE